jgi:hypothetical protein
LKEPLDVYLISPTPWDPHNDAYAFNEEALLDWEGDMVEKKHQDYRIVLEDVSEDPAMVESLSISSVEKKAIDSLRQSREEELAGDLFHMSHSADLYDKLIEQREISAFKMGIGSTDCGKGGDYYLEDDASQAQMADDSALESNGSHAMKGM